MEKQVNLSDPEQRPVGGYLYHYTVLYEPRVESHPMREFLATW